MAKILTHCKEINLDKTNALGQNVFHIAAINDRSGIMKNLLEVVGDQLTQQDKRGMIPLHYAAMRGSYPCVNLILNYTQDKHGEDEVKALCNFP